MTEQQIRDLAERHALRVEKSVKTGSTTRHFADFHVFGPNVLPAWHETRKLENPDCLRGEVPLTRCLHCDNPEHPDYRKPFIEFGSVWCEID